MSKNQTCFISYCREDNDIKTIKYLINSLYESSNEKINFLIDEDLPVGHSFNDFMNLINSADAVIVLLTPGYKRKCEDRNNSGVNYEYKLILNRLEKSSGHRGKWPSFCYIPLIFSRNFNDTCPTHIKDRKALDFSDFIINDHGLPSSIESKYKQYFNVICSQILTVESLNKESVNFEYRKLLDILFIETKQDNISPTDIGKNKNLYVKTNSFRALRKQTTYFFLGRKGSGKTTLSHVLCLLHGDRYKEHVKITVDSIKLEYSYSIIMSDNSIYKDIEVVLSLSIFFRYVWEIFLYIKCFFVIINELEKGTLSDSQVKFTPIIKEFLQVFDKQVINQNSFFYSQEKISIKNSLFQWCLSKSLIQIDKIIKEARPDESSFHFDVSNAIIRENFIQKVIPKNALLSFYSIIKRCERNFFVSFDGFDNMFEEFRKNSKTYAIEIQRKRNNFEKSFLEGFIELIDDIKGNPSGDIFYSVIAACVTVPKDRFLEIKYEKRDSYRYISRFHEIKWSGIELAIMLRKRLDIISKTSSSNTTYNNSDGSAEERFRKSIANEIPNLPEKTNIRVGKRHWDIDTFINILRHTFWRPREIIIYYAKIIAVLKDYEKRNILPNNYSISKIISETTFDIINEEFISEFINYCTNLSEILICFNDSKQIINYKSLEEKISETSFHLINEILPQNSMRRKIEFLWDIGFLGIEVSEKIRDRYKLLAKDVFCFNVSNRTFDILKLSNYQDCNFIIHSIFCEYLNLETSNQERLVLNFDWDYLRKQDLHVRP